MFTACWRPVLAVIDRHCAWICATVRLLAGGLRRRRGGEAKRIVLAHSLR